MREKFTFNFGSGKIVLEKGFYETREHIVLKLLAYIYLNRSVSIERHITQKYRYKPDLLREDSGQVKIWAECGKVTVRKLCRIANSFKDTEIYVFKPDHASLSTFTAALKKAAVDNQRLKLIAFDNDFVSVVSNALIKSNCIKYSKTENSIDISVNNLCLTSTIVKHAFQ